MIKEDNFSIIDISRELQIGTASTKFLINRFNPWIPQNSTPPPVSYPRESVSLLLDIKNELDAGMLPSEIEQRLAENKPIASPPDSNPEKMDFPTVISLLHDINAHQKRIAKASELRAAAEEKRALAEEEKAKAMNRIASTLEQLPGLPDMGLLGLGQLSDIPPAPQTPPPSKEGAHLPASLDQGEISPLEDLSELIAMESKESVEEELSQALLSDLPVEEDFNSDTSLDDLLAASAPKETDVDDLSLLLAPEEKEETPEGMDDLWALVEDEKELDTKTESILPEDKGLDDLNLLIEEEPSPPLDDLNLLVDEAPSPTEIDDLSELIEKPEIKEDKEEKLFEKPDITPEMDVAAYKAAIMKIILQLKTKGLNAEETTKAFNAQGVLTLSGKPQWKIGAISKIYRFIDEAS